MARNGSGGYTQPVADFVSGEVASATTMNQWLDDLGSEIANSIAADGQTPATGNLPMAAFKHTGVGKAAAADQYVRADQAQNNELVWGGTASGTTTITITVSPAPSAYAAGQAFLFMMGTSASGATPTLNVNSLGAKSIVKLGGGALAGNDIAASTLVSVIYDGTNFILFGPGAAVGVLGEFRAIAHSSVPGGWLLCYGQAVSRTTYAALFNVLSTTWGVGDGSTTFNLPDLRGRALFGKDNMGGSAANRLTAGVSGITGTTLGATGGSEALHAHGHNITDPGHAHTVVAFGGSGSSATGPGPLGVGLVATDAQGTGISINTAGSGSSQNMPPAAVANIIIYAGA